MLVCEFVPDKTTNHQTSQGVCKLKATKDLLEEELGKDSNPHFLA